MEPALWAVAIKEFSEVILLFFYLFFETYFYLCVGMCVCVCMCMEVRIGYQIPLELELHLVLSSQEWVLGVELRSSMRTIRALNH